MPHLGTYRRALPVDLERLYENAIDWEHLPYLHRSTFARIERIDSGAWGFRARAWQSFRQDNVSFVLELRLDRACRRWITRTLEGPGSSSEVWTHAFPIGERRTDIIVDFFVPGVNAQRASALLEFYTQLYSRLYDEDVAMMTVRQQRLDEVTLQHDHSPSRRELGPIDELRSSLPLVVEFAGQSFRLLEIEGELIAHSTVCPHMLGPLANGKLLDRATVECPWHGYQFDIRSGSCVKGGKCTLAPAPRVEVNPATLIATLVAPNAG